jgi:hypothetical protein
MNDRTTDAGVRSHIRELMDREHRLLDAPTRSEDEHAALHSIEVELDQCWDLLRQRRAAREMGQDPGQAHLRPPDVVEKYIG